MKDKTSASLEALTGLLGERQRYEEWLSALESRKASTPDSVYQKVRADYESRLKDVSDRLGARADELRSHIDTLTAKLQDISKEETAQHEARQEAEVRAAVGEYTEEEWLRIKNESEKQLSRIAGERTSTESQLAELNRVFTLSTNPGATAAAAPVRVSSAPPKPPPAVEQNAAKRMGTGGWPQRDGDPSASTISVSPGISSDRVAAKPAESASPLDEFSTFTQRASADGAGAKSDDVKASGSPAATTTKSKRGGLPDLRTEQQKTLKCPECGAMNYPTEWYCERCGGELATL
jgi:hypothetical protein